MLFCQKVTADAWTHSCTSFVMQHGCIARHLIPGLLVMQLRRAEGLYTRLQALSLSCRPSYVGRLF